MKVLKASLAYFGIVFGVGFLLGMIRVPLLVPAVGERWAELIELPFLLIAIFFASRWVVRSFRFRQGLFEPLLVGVTAAGLLLVVEFSVVLWLRGQSISAFLANRDLVAGTLYYVAVGIFALMPLIQVHVNRRRESE